MKSVLISINPRWCKLIASGKKTVEVRKTKPKLDVPFKVYIYCTQGKQILTQSAFCDDVSNGKIVGEFVCDDIDTIAVFNDLLYCVKNSQANKLKQMCLTIDEIKKYLGSKNIGYNWHISKLVIYDKPRELGEFWNVKCTNKKCGCVECEIKPNCINHLTRPPQSWCYVESEEGHA